ncbi:MAG: hypothetical protein WC943_17390, partial [Elusimicrobiota bacterium]
MAAMERRFVKSEGFASAAGGYWLSRGNLDKAGASADRAIGLAKPGGDPKLGAKVWTIKGLVEFQRGDMESAYSAGKAAFKADPDNRAALELMMYSESALHLRGMDELVAERTKRVLALTDPGFARTPGEWAARQEERPTAAGAEAAEAI